MKTITRSLLILLMISFSGTLKAADPVFVVYFVKGKIIKQGTQSRVLKSGDPLMETDKFQLPAGSEIIIICKNSTPLRLKSKGEYTVRNLLSLCTKNSESTTSAYFKYVWNEFTHPEASPEKDPRNYMKTSGAVSRGYEAVDFVTSIDTVHYSIGKLNLRWTPDVANVRIKVYNSSEDGKLLLERKLNSGILPIDSIARELGAPGEYYWGIWDASDREPGRHYLKIWEKKEYRKFVSNLVKQINAVPSKAEKFYLRGFILEEHHFLTEASLYYKKAFQKEPENPIYKKAYESFNF